MTVKDRMLALVNYTKLSKRKFQESIGVSNSYIQNISESIGADVLNRITIRYPEINIHWLMTGDGKMLLEGSEYEADKNFKTGVPYYDDLPVSAGQLDIALHDSQPSGYIDIPGLRAQALFPVVGCSMKPEINPGDIIGVESLNSWDSIDPDKVYMIITSDDRMIKHLEIDDEDKEVLWCVSPNYKRFKIAKSNIKAIYRICYVGKLI